ncbi:hypothetical protein A2U01_0005976 [Trifolium medium]|uniref:Uncharacterized protein n=1 Tax=Trifolium medium TaxID=97028 RepID=A0A392MFV0_9FABA|nr:hypothetical protein [Trifolium medium]
MWKNLHHGLPTNSLCAGGEELEGRILQDCSVVKPVWYSFRTCLSQNFFDQGVNERVECNIASRVGLDERNQVVFNKI